MWPFDSRAQTMPRRWADMSLEFKGMFLYHVAMMALFALPVFAAPLLGGLPDHMTYVFIAAGIALSIAIGSAFRRARLDWHWRGAGVREIAAVIFTTLLMGFFASSITGKFPPPVGLMPWYLALTGIYLFTVLQILHVVHFAEADFRAECGEAPSAPQPATPREAGWKRVTRAVFGVFFLAVWLEGVGFFYVHSRALEHSSPEPVGAQTWSIEEHGRHNYVTKEEYDRDAALKALMFIGIPAALATGALLQFVLGINFGWRRADKER